MESRSVAQVSYREMRLLGYQYVCGLYLKEETVGNLTFVHLVRALPDGSAPVGGQHYSIAQVKCA